MIDRRPECIVIDMGRVAYGEALRLQERMVEERQAGQRPDTVVVLEHPAVITLGRGGHREHLLVSVEGLESAGVALYDSPRGGDITCHEPGQLVVYPILKLEPPRQDVRRYVTGLEEVVLRTLADFGIEGGRSEGQRGVWVGNEKVAAVGVRISRWITSHGLALNVCNDLSTFRLIVPCGIKGRGVTSMSRLAGRSLAVAQARERVLLHFAEVFECTLRPGP